MPTEEMSMTSKEVVSTADTEFDVKATVKDGQLQLSMPVTSCSVCSDGRSVEDLRLPVMKGFIGENKMMSYVILAVKALSYSGSG